MFGGSSAATWLNIPIWFTAQQQYAKNSVALTSEIRLFHGTQEVFIKNVAPATVAKVTGNEAIVVAGSFVITDALAPGEYFLRVISTNPLAPRDRQTSSQWIDFEIVK